MRHRNSLVAAIALMASALPMPALAIEVHRDDLPDMVEGCQRERQRHLAPMREEAIQRCVDGGMRNREECERRNADFGERRHSANGHTMPGLFWDLPICQQADAADRFFRANPRSNTFTLE